MPPPFFAHMHGHLEAAGMIPWDKHSERCQASFPIDSRLFERLCQ